ncbi:copper resistance protein CopC [Microvirga sp. BT689]|uniref:copper resistance CopC/CopD family protein n=1 Tax=Microvirga arvi TaxID=2778731 RepID=UPI00195116ED|nr:CopD family protein [Microvirga arvi]MBM6583022.1 copper resistance protein CopC [Microvirga arvi]
MFWLTLAILGGMGHALAHAALVESHPADGASVEEAPATVRLHFNEPVSPLVVSLTDARGQVHRGLHATARNEVLEVAIPGDLPRGSHVLSYRVASGDGHPVGGSIVFSVGAATGSGPAAGLEGNEAVRRGLWLARVALYLGLFAGAGGAFFQAWLTPGLKAGRTRRVLTGFVVLGILAATISLGLQGVDALGETPASLGTVAAWAAGWRTSFGPTSAIGAVALVLAGMGLRGQMGWRRVCTITAMAGVGLSLAWSGHASAAAPQWLTRPAVFLHAVGVAYWVGALIPLLFAIRQAPAQALPVVRRFSTGALMAVAMLTLAGLVLAAIQVEAPANLTGTDYGRVLIAKTILVVTLLGLAALNRMRLTPALASPGGTDGRWLVRSVAVEIVLSVAILALVGLWRFTPPPRALAASAEATASASVHLHSPRIMAQVTLSPGRAGVTRARIVIASGRAEPTSPKEVILVLARPEAGIEAIARPARRDGRQGWLVEGLVLPQAGAWQVRVDILVDDFEKSSLEGSISIRP